MDRLSPEIALKKIRMRELPPEIQVEIQEISKELHYGGTIKSSSSLQFLYELYQAQKENHDEKALKKAEKMIMSLATLSHARIYAHKKEKKKGKLKLVSEPKFQLVLSEKVIGAFLHLGITDEEFMHKAVGQLGETEIIERADLVLASNLDEKTRESLFGKHPEILLVPNTDLFVQDVEIIEKKKEIFDMMLEFRAVPGDFDYRFNPGALLMDSKQIKDLLGLEIMVPARETPEGESKEKSGQLPTLSTRQFIKRMKRLGFEKARGVRHGAFYKNEETGKMIMIQNQHGSGNRPMETGIIREKLREAEISIKEFNEA